MLLDTDIELEPLLVQELQDFYWESQRRCLWTTAQWTLELLSCLIESKDSSKTFLKQQLSSECCIELARSFFELKQFKRAWNVLNENKDKESSHALFLKLYSLYMAGEKEQMAQKEAEWTGAKPLLHAQHCVAIETELSDIQSTTPHVMDSFLYFLYGIACKKLNLKEKAQDALIQSIECNPLNWASYLELESFISNAQECHFMLKKLPNQHAMTWMFQLKICIETDYFPIETVQSWFETLEQNFPNFEWLKAQRALMLYHQRDFDECQVLFQELHAKNPFNLDYVDTFSNVLYVKNELHQLSLLARTVFEMDCYTPETCNVIGNYYSLKGEREKAISYFERALRLDPNYVAAWTLLGHEFLELKNWNAAINAYRHAIHVSPKDYRAWFGLGQAYELLRMPLYALFYIQKAAALRPYDTRIWQALGDVYKGISKPSEALLCFKRALVGSDAVDPMIYSCIAQLYQEKKNRKEAANWFQLFVEDGRGTEKEIESACIFLTQYFIDLKNLSKASVYLEEILHTEQGKCLQREMKSLEKSKIAVNKSIDWV